MLKAAAVSLVIAGIGSAAADAAPLGLVLADVGLDDSGVALLAKAVQECGDSGRRLSLLDLYDNPLGDAGAAALLGAIATCTRNVAARHQQTQLAPVERLDLGCTNISDACADALLELFCGDLPRLRAIGIAFTDLSVGVLHQLQERGAQQQISGDSHRPRNAAQSISDSCAGGTVVIHEQPRRTSTFVDVRGTVGPHVVHSRVTTIH